MYGTSAYNDPLNSGYKGGVKAAYDYRAFGEQVDLTEPTDKVTENFTGKEKDDETELNYFGARYLDPMLGMWTSVDPKRQFSSPYLYVGNGVNPVVGVDPDGIYSLNLNEDNTVASMTSDEYDNTISVYDANGDFLNNFEAPDAGSYFFSKNNNGEYNIINKVFDVNMQKNANEMMFEVNSSFFPFSYVKWYSGFDFDFKHRYYSSQGQSVYTIGALNGTIMTARDAGNALWGTLMRDRGWSRSTTNYISDKIAGGKEDFESKSMQMWGYDKVYEQMKISSPK